METMVIKRSEWSRGNGGTLLSSFLFNSFNGQRCCLGFLGNHVGFEDGELDGVPLPSGYRPVDGWPEQLFVLSGVCRRPHEGKLYPPDWESVFAIINDTPGIDEETREAWIKEGFRQILNINVEFVD